jgi:hypothetical protein
MGCSTPSCSSPSMVVTARSAARKAGTRQLCMGVLSSQTVHAPQSPASHPFLTPKKPSSRTNVRRHWPGWGSAENSLPLTVTFIEPLLPARRESARHSSA